MSNKQQKPLTAEEAFREAQAIHCYDYVIDLWAHPDAEVISSTVDIVFAENTAQLLQELEQVKARINDITPLLQCVVEEYEDVSSISSQNVCLISAWLDDNPSGIQA